MPDFGMGGPVLDNTTWWNSTTGDSFTVRNNYMEDNDMIILTTDGRTFKMSQLANGYVQWHGEGRPPKQPIQPAKPTTVQEADLPPEVASEIATDSPEDLIDPEDLAMINGANALQAPVPPAPQLPKTKAAVAITQPAAPANDTAIIERALKKAKDPNWSLSMKWPGFPQDEIKLLHTVMGIPIEDIADYYMNKIVGEFDSFMDNIKDQLSDYILGKIAGEAEPKIQPYKKPAKTNAKTTKTTKK